MAQKIRLGISTCPNDTFAFHALIERKIDLRDFEFEIELRDVQHLNDALFEKKFDILKVSFFAALSQLDRVCILDSGSALGFGNGPLLLSSGHRQTPSEWIGSRNPIVLTPGKDTTAQMLYRVFHGNGEIRDVIFSDIMPALQDKSADYGVCIHEGRFTWEEQGLTLIEDLGSRWEEATKCPLPLGGIVAEKNLGVETLKQLQQIVRESVEYGINHRDETLSTMRKYAQEFSDEVLFSHVDLYVNQWTIRLEEQGRLALENMLQMCRTISPELFERAKIEFIAG